MILTAALGTEIDAINASIYLQINSGVYWSGFAKSQEAYNVAVSQVLDEVLLMVWISLDRSCL